MSVTPNSDTAMSPSSATVRKATVYTGQLAGSILIELLDAAEDDRWPNSQCAEEWVLLRNGAMQTETLMVDEEENLAWERRMRELAHKDLPYPELIEARGEALKARTRARKLAQTNLRYKYGYRGARRWGLMRNAVRDLPPVEQRLRTHDALPVR